MRVLNSVILRKNVEGGTLWHFLTFMLQKIEKLEGGSFADIKKTFKKSLTKPK